LRPGTVYVAPGGRHMMVNRTDSNGRKAPVYSIALSDAAPENSVRPSADILFRSVAEAYGGRILAVVLTGMGSDGMKGVSLLKKRGCYCLTQEEHTCVVYGMPRAVDEAALSDERVPLKDMARRITQIINGSGK
ncbi:MAG: CheB methylesterase domain-containing protein, partial [Desulfobacteraceae bacterium]